ncbi:MAG: FAD linked oxidase domain protein [Chloroflexi bacterium OLB15]|nr:MAG: FAD linked oxidase domain protein [Chloroflexi bacterium OLB15]
MSSAAQTLEINQLREQIAGSVFTAEDAAYQEARLAWNRAVDQYPALIIKAKNAQDVVAGIRFARQHGLGVSVQSTGHGLHIAANDALLIVMADMNAVTVDPAARTARVEGGAIWQDVLAVATPLGLAPLLGSSPGVGVVGYTLGGGISWLARKYGFAADSVRWIEVVTADGELRRVSPTENTDLFWAVRGGGGAFGAVTALEFDLYPVPTVYGGNLIYPAGLASDVLHRYREWIDTVPDELTSSVVVMKFPDLPFVPEPMRGLVQVFVRAVYTGDVAEGAALLQSWVNWRAPIANTFAEIPFSQIGTVSSDPEDPVSAYNSNETLTMLSDQAIEAILGAIIADDSPFYMMDMRHGQGALQHKKANPSALSNRDTKIYLQMGGAAFSPEAYKRVQSAVQRLNANLRDSARGGYLNFMSGPEAKVRVQSVYPPETLARLQAIKREYDPENLFRFTFQFA